MDKGAAENIILTGFSYTGKTKVGQEVAERLGWRFIDIDDEIVLKCGKPIADVFAQDGEERFRELELRIGELERSQERAYAGLTDLREDLRDLEDDFNKRLYRINLYVRRIEVPQSDGD